MNEIYNLLFVELAEGEAQPVEILRVGEFLDRNGRRITVTLEDLDTFVSNFKARVAGQEVPLDIGHERAEAAGWLKALWRDGERLLGLPDWNALGQRLIKERIYRYLSASIDMGKKVIKSVSLVNFPSVKGLRPVELSEGVYVLQAEEGWLEALVARIAAVIREMLGGGPPGEPAPEETMAELVIRKEGSEIVLYSADGSKVLGRFPFGSGEEYESEDAAREAASKREREIQYFKHREGGELENDWAELQGNIRQIIGAWTKWAGSFTKCVRVLKGKPGISNEEALCAWLHHEAEGKWPAEGAEYSPNVAELQALAGALSSVIIESQEVDSMNEQELAELREQIRKELLAELEQENKHLADLREQVKAEVEAEMAEKFQRRGELVKFAEEICGGDSAALSSTPSEVVEFLESLDENAAEQAMVLLKSKVVDFGERGSSREGEGTKEQLPALYTDSLKLWVESGQSIEEFFNLNRVELGEMGDYDLSQFSEQEANRG